MLTFGSLFAGIGGFDLGLERAGLTCKWQVEIDPYCRKVLEKHWPEAARHDDITTFSPGPQHYVDLIAAGFPCQDISIGGRGAGIHGSRSRLFFEAIRVVRQVGPRFVLLENVAALLNRGLDTVLGELAAIGLDAEWHCIPAAALGAPHIRDRVFILAYPADDRWPGPICCNAPNVANPMWTAVQSSSALDPRLSLFEAFEQRVGQPAVFGVDDGLPNRVDRLAGPGNAIVPQIAEWIGRRLIEATLRSGTRNPRVSLI